MSDAPLSPAQLDLLRVVRISDEDHGGLDASEVSADEREALDGLVARGLVEVVGEFGEAPDGEEDELHAGQGSVVYRITGSGVDALLGAS